MEKLEDPKEDISVNKMNKIEFILIIYAPSFRRDIFLNIQNIRKEGFVQ